MNVVSHLKSKNWSMLEIHSWYFSVCHRTMLTRKFHYHTKFWFRKLVYTDYFFYCYRRYSTIKKACYETNPIASQVVTKKLLTREKGFDSIVTKVAVQMCTKLGGAPWMPSKIPIARAMTIGNTFANLSFFYYLWLIIMFCRFWCYKRYGWQKEIVRLFGGNDGFKRRCRILFDRFGTPRFESIKPRFRN